MWREMGIIFESFQGGGLFWGLYRSSFSRHPRFNGAMVIDEEERKVLRIRNCDVKVKNPEWSSRKSSSRRWRMRWFLFLKGSFLLLQKLLLVGYCLVAWTLLSRWLHSSAKPFLLETNVENIFCQLAFLRFNPQATLNNYFKSTFISDSNQLA